MIDVYNTASFGGFRLVLAAHDSKSTNVDAITLAAKVPFWSPDKAPSIPSNAAEYVEPRSGTPTTRKSNRINNFLTTSYIPVGLPI